MSASRAFVSLSFVLAFVAGFASRSSAAAIYVSSGSVGSDSIAVTVGFYDDPNYPAGHPEWIGYDILRRPVPACGNYVRVNAVPLPRVPSGQEVRYAEVPPAHAQLYEYRVLLVDANRNEVILDPPCDCFRSTWACCPDLSAALCEGTLSDLGWALTVQPCAGVCYGSFYFTGPLVDQLRPLVQTGAVLRFFGMSGCTAFEGCGMGVDHYEATTCEAVPAARTSWGRIKAIYR